MNITFIRNKRFSIDYITGSKFRIILNNNIAISMMPQPQNYNFRSHRLQIFLLFCRGAAEWRSDAKKTKKQKNKFFFQYLPINIYFRQNLLCFFAIYSLHFKCKWRIHNESVPMILTANELVVVKKKCSQLHCVFSCPSENIWCKILPLRSDEKNG